MPYPIPDIKITPQQCFTDPKIYQQMIGIIDLFQYMSTESYRGLSKSWIDKYINQGDYNIYLTGGRALHVVLNTIKPKLNSPFWKTFDWALMNRLYAENCDYDIQCCWKNKVELRRIDNVMLHTFNMMKHRIRAHTSTVASDSLFCSNGMIDIAWIQQPVNRIDLMNTSFRINLITGELECLSETGFNLLILANQLDVPDIIKYIEQPKQSRALSKMTFVLRSIAKAFKLNFVASDNTKDALDYATRKRSYANMLQTYSQQKFSKLRENHDESKLAHIDTLAGTKEQSWLERILLQHRKNDEKFRPSLSHIPAASTADILNNIKLIISFNRKPRDQADGVEMYLKDTLEYYMASSKLKELIAELECIGSNNAVYTKGLALCRKSFEKLEPKSPIQTSQKTEESKPEQSACSAAPFVTSPIYKRKTKNISDKRLLRIIEIQRKITPEKIKMFKKRLDQEYTNAYFDASVNYDRFIKDTAPDSHFAFIKLPEQERKRLREIRNILRKDSSILFPSALYKIFLCLIYQVVAFMTIYYIQDSYQSKDCDCEPSYQISVEWLLVKLVAAVLMLFCGVWRANSISLKFLVHCGLDDNMRGLSQSLDKFKRESTDENHYKILIHIGMCIKYAKYFYPYQSCIIQSLGSQFLTNKDMAIGIERLTGEIYQKSWREESSDVFLCTLLQAFAELDINDLKLILSHPTLPFKDETLEGVREELQEMLDVLKAANSPLNHSGGQCETKHPLPSLQM